jgi:hypothetical protein
MQIVQQLIQQQQSSISSWQLDQPPAAADQQVWQKLLQRAQQLAKPGTRIYLLSDWATQQPSHWQLLQALQRHCQVHAVQLYDPLERQLPRQLSGYNLSLTDSIRHWRMPAHASNSRSEFQQYAAQQQLLLEQAMQQHGLVISQVSAAAALEQQWPELRL